MSAFDDELRQRFPDYDFDAIEQSAAALAPREPFSQAREAQKLTPVIEVLLASHPQARATAIADMLVHARRDGQEALGPTFRREVGTIVHAIKAAPAAEPKAGSGSAQGKRRRDTRRDTATGDANTRATIPAAAVAPSPTVNAARSEMAGAATTTASPSRLSAQDEQPYRYSGRFAGKVFTHGSELRAFFSAVEKGLPLQRVADLVAPVLASPTSRARLGDLAPADRDIFEAMARWAKAHDA